MPQRKPRLTAKIKFDIYIQTRAKDAPVGEILRKYGLHLADLKQIEEAVENGAISALKTRSPKSELKEVTTEDYIALQKELERKEKALAELSVEYTILKKKRQIGLHGPLTNQHIEGDTRKAIIGLIDEGVAGGITQSKACKVIDIDERRIQRWRKQAEAGSYTRKPGTGIGHIPFNALTNEENKLVLSMIASREHADDSARVLSVKAMEKHGIYVSHVTFHSRMVDRGVNGPRGIHAKRRTRHSKPDTGELTGPNQLWAWDISYIKTTTRYQSYYLYALLDCWSRKVIAWHISGFLSSDEVQTLWDKGLLNEGIYGSDKLFPRSLCDRGSQMRSTSTKAFFTTLGVYQYFSRPNTPNDNPQIESLFSTVKNFPAYPERFASLSDAEQYFTKFFSWYNNEHYHTGIGMVTPVQRHTGQDIEIFKEREAIKKATLEVRRLANCKSPEAAVSR